MRVAAAGIGASSAIVAGFDDDAAVFELDDDAAAIELVAFAVEANEAGAIVMAFTCRLAAFGSDLAG